MRAAEKLEGGCLWTLCKGVGQCRLRRALSVSVQEGHLLLPHGAAMLLAAPVLLLSLARLLVAHQRASCQPLLPTEALLLLSLQAAWENAGLQHAMSCMMAQQAAWAASGPMHGAVPGYELGHPFDHSGEPAALNPGQGALHVLPAARTRSTLPPSPLLPACRATASVSGQQNALQQNALPRQHNMLLSCSVLVLQGQVSATTCSPCQPLASPPPSTVLLRLGRRSRDTLGWHPMPAAAGEALVSLARRQQCGTQWHAGSSCRHSLCPGAARLGCQPQGRSRSRLDWCLCRANPRVPAKWVRTSSSSRLLWCLCRPRLRVCAMMSTSKGVLTRQRRAPPSLPASPSRAAQCSPGEHRGCSRAQPSPHPGQHTQTGLGRFQCRPQAPSR